MTTASRIIAGTIAIFLLNVGLNWPLFLPGDSPYRDTIEAGYQGMSRFIADHPSPWGWNPLQYCGLPAQFMYLPVLHYASAAMSYITTLAPAYWYKLLTAAIACFTPAMLFLVLRLFTGSTFWSAMAALGFTFVSPLYGLIPQLDRDRGIVYLPWRMHVFAKYGEGPHVAGFTFMLAALAAAWYAGRNPRYWTVPLAALLFAIVCLTNWVAALALGICCALLMLAAAGEAGFSHLRLLGAALLAYGLACFWLTPTFIETVAFNWPVDAFNYRFQQAQRWLLVGWSGGIIGLRALTWALKWPFFATFSALGLWAFGFPVLIHYSWGIDMLPESRRYAIEFSLFLFLALTEFFRFCCSGLNAVRLACAGAVLVPLLVAAAPQVRRYLTQGHQAWMPRPLETTSEYRAAKWIAAQNPGGRVLASGGLRFRLNSWFDLPQVGGAFESGVRNRHPLHFAYQIRTGLGSRPDQEGADAVLQMKALGVEYVVVHGPRSEEHYRDYVNPVKFDGVLPRVYAEEDTWIYRVPFQGLAHLVRPDEQPEAAHRDRLHSYVAALDDTARPRLHAEWRSPSLLQVTGPVPAGYQVAAAVTWDSGWEARQDGSTIELTANQLGFLVASPRPSGNSMIVFEYRGTPEQRAAAVLSFAVWTGTLLFLRRRWRAESGYGEKRWQKPSSTSAAA